MVDHTGRLRLEFSQVRRRAAMHEALPERNPLRIDTFSAFRVTTDS